MRERKKRKKLLCNLLSILDPVFTTLLKQEAQEKHRSPVNGNTQQR